MKRLNPIVLLTAVALLLAALTGCADSRAETETTTAPTESQDLSLNLGEAGMFRPVDCGLPAMAAYEYPFLGMTAVLPQAMLDRLDSREVFVFTEEDYTDSNAIAYAVLRFSETTEAQRAEEVMSIDILAWEAALKRVGAIGVYRKDAMELPSALDERTGCDTHEKIGESSDGAYAYYLSSNSGGSAELVAELKAAEITLSEMHELDMSLGYSAFSTDRIDGIETVGEFTTEDIFGQTYTQDIFAENDLTLVNAFATWCSPCVEEMPELEKLRQAYAEKGIKFGVVAVVLDIRTTSGIDEGASERAKTLYERSGAQFPFLIPDAGNMNGRLTGIESVPESFFVDSNGNIVSEPYIGSNSLEGWKTVVDAELAALTGTGA